MKHDPIVEEIHAAREKIAKRCGYDIHRIAELAREKESAGKRPRARKRKTRAKRQTVSIK